VAAVDDPLDAVAVHMGGGMWGLMATPLLMEDGILYGNLDGFQILAWNAAGLFTIIAWAGGFCTIMFSLMRRYEILRVPPEMEIQGEWPVFYEYYFDIVRTAKIVFDSGRNTS
jgi:Amt family ammonium transporter